MFFFWNPCKFSLLFLIYFTHLNVVSHGIPFVGLEVKLQWEVLFALCRPFYKFQGRKAVYFSHICFVPILCDTVCWMLFFLTSTEMGNLHCCKMLKPNLILQNCVFIIFLSSSILHLEYVLNWCHKALILNVKLYILVLFWKNSVYPVQLIIIMIIIKDLILMISGKKMTCQSALHFHMLYFRKNLKSSLL